VWYIYSQLTVYEQWGTGILQIMLVLRKMDRNIKRPQKINLDTARVFNQLEPA